MKVLIVKTSALGDVIQCFSALHLLKRHFPHAEIHWIVEWPFGELLRAHPHVDQVLEVKTRKWKKTPFMKKNWEELSRCIKEIRNAKYDVAFDLQGNFKSGILIGCARSKKKVGFSRCSAPEWPNLLFTRKRLSVDETAAISSQYLSLIAKHFGFTEKEVFLKVDLLIKEEEREWIDTQMRKGERWMICMGSNWENKKLSPKMWEKFLKNSVSKWNPTFYFVWGNEKEKSEAHALANIFSDRAFLLPRMSLPVWQQMMKQMHLVLSVDSSALHLAATTKTPTYSFFGPSAQKIYRPIGERHGSFQGACPYNQTFIKRCALLRSCSTGACLKEVSDQTLFDAFKKWMERRYDKPITEESRSKSMCDSTS